LLAQPAQLTISVRRFFVIDLIMARFARKGRARDGRFARRAARAGMASPLRGS
jgi:hypothetical protein